MSRIRLPLKLELPFGYDVTVQQGETSEEDHGDWDVSTRTIVIDRKLTPAEKRAVFLHELEHAWTDFKLWVAQNIAIKYPEGLEPDPEERDEEDSAS